jgi:hypothetical protein
MSEPSMVVDLRSRSDPDSLEFCLRYDRYRWLLASKHQRELSPLEWQELSLLKQQIYRSLALWIEKR